MINRPSRAVTPGRLLRGAGALSIVVMALGLQAMAPIPADQSIAGSATEATAPKPELDDDTAILVNPTGRPVRGADDYGSGLFGARRDGGARVQAGVDFVADPGQTVVAPISGRVKRLGFAYASDLRYRYVEIENQAKTLLVRVLYVGPSVQVGDQVDQRQVIGTAQDLSPRYRGITNHVHLQVADAGRTTDATQLM